MVLFAVPLSTSGAGATAVGGLPDWSDPDSALPCDRLGEIVTGMLEGGETVSFPFDLEPGVYSFAAWASLDLLSLHVEIRDPIGALLDRDLSDDNSPVCLLRLESAVTVEVVLSGGEARVPGAPGAYAFASAIGDGCFERQAMPGKEILDDWTGLIADEGGVVTHWEVAELTGGDMVVFTYQLPAGSFTAIAETANPGDDIDMYIKLDPETIIEKDELPDNAPVCHFELDFPAEITIEIDPWKYGEGSTGRLVLLVARDADEES